MAKKRRRSVVSTRMRFEVFKRDGFQCQYCGAHPPGVLLHVDHVVAVAAGGDNSTDNLVTSCAPCNLGKGAVDLRVVPQSLGEKAKETAEREAQLAGYQQIFEAKRARLDAEVWLVLKVLRGESCESVPRDEYNSVKLFVEKLGVHEVIDAAEIALASNVYRARIFRYFCGVCWNKIRGPREG